MSELKVIVTHSETFHCDEVLAYSLLRKLPQYQTHTLVRTRNPDEIAKGDIVIDVGGVFDVEKNRFDHHQRGFAEVFGVGKFTRTKLSSAGLVYKYFGKDIFRHHYKVQDENLVEIMYKKIYGTFIESIDAIDNGVTIAPPGTEQQYKINSDLSSRVSRFNPRWNEENVDVNSRFLQAADVCFEEFDAHCQNILLSWWPARQIVERCFENRTKIHPSGRIIELDQFCPWKEHLEDIEAENQVADEDAILYAIFADTSGSWRVGTLNVKDNAFLPRKPFPEPIRGLRDQELSDKVGIPDLIFVHAAGFIGGAKTRESALKLAEYSLNN